jgi:hypothetical protein
MDVTVSEILKRARAEAQEATAAREAAQARAAAAVADADAAVEREKAALAVQSWVEQQATAPAPPAEPTGEAPAPVATRFGRPVPEVTNTDLTLQVLEDLGKPASTTEIRERLAQDGHELTQTQVRSTLKYLARKPAYGVTTEPGSGVWRIDRSALNGAGDRRAPAG